MNKDNSPSMQEIFTSLSQDLIGDNYQIPEYKLGENFSQQSLDSSFNFLAQPSYT